MQVKCIIGEQDIKVKIIYTDKQELKITINNLQRRKCHLIQRIRKYITYELTEINKDREECGPFQNDIVLRFRINVADWT